MKARGLDAVCAPVVVERLVRDTVLVTEWVDGSRLDSDASPDVPRLCGVALNAYLTMLLDTGVPHPRSPEIARDRPRSPEMARHGRAPQRVISDPSRAISLGVLHCDPHPGNLLRTTDGKLCILDWGMTLEVPSNLQYALLEFIAHLNVEDYDAVRLGTGGSGEQPSVKDRTPRPTPKQVPQDFINLGFSPEGCACFHRWGAHRAYGPGSP